MKKSSNKNFGILFSIVFFVIGLWPLFSDGTIRIWSLVLSIVFLVVSFLKPILFKFINNAWIRLGEILGKLIAPIVMALIFFFILTPMSLTIRILGKDILKLKMLKNKSYWIERENKINSMDKQF